MAVVNTIMHACEEGHCWSHLKLSDRLRAKKMVVACIHSAQNLHSAGVIYRAIMQTSHFSILIIMGKAQQSRLSILRCGTVFLGMTT